MRRIGLTVVLILGLVLAPLAGEAQQAPKVPKVGFLGVSPFGCDRHRVGAHDRLTIPTMKGER